MMTLLTRPDGFLCRDARHRPPAAPPVRPARRLGSVAAVPPESSVLDHRGHRDVDRAGRLDRRVVATDVARGTLAWAESATKAGASVAALEAWCAVNADGPPMRLRI